jgi:hypothetical protein
MAASGARAVEDNFRIGHVIPARHSQRPYKAGGDHRILQAFDLAAFVTDEMGVPMLMRGIGGTGSVSPGAIFTPHPVH